MARELGDRRGEAIALGNLSEILFARGEHEKAINYARTSLQLREEIGDPYAAKLKEQLDSWQAALSQGLAALDAL